jgi:hypothetical protein
MSNWNDDILRGFDTTIKLYNVVLNERAQLYGSLIQVMLQNDVTYFELPIEDAKFIAKNYYILFKPNDDNTILSVELKVQETDEE